MTFMRKIIFLFICVGVLSSLGCAGTNGKGGETVVDPLSGVIDFYRGPLNHLSAVRYGECPMYPSCSAYSRSAIQKHGMVIGWMMAHDRLMRCGRDEKRVAPKVFVNGKWKYYDPVEENDRWWSEPETLAPADVGGNGIESHE